MSKPLRPILAVAALAVSLTACGWLNALIPDQTIASLLGIPSGGVEVDLEAASVATTAVAPAAGDPTTVFVGSIQGTQTVAALADAPDFVVVASITEAVSLEDTVVVRHPGSNTGDFTVSAVAVSGSLTVDGESFDIPPGAGTAGLALAFTNPSCVSDGADQVCTYETASDLPEFDVVYSDDQIEAVSALLRNGGEVEADVTVTLTLVGPGLPDDAVITVTVTGGEAVVAF